MATNLLHLPFSLHGPPSSKPTPLLLRTSTTPPRAPSPSSLVAPLRPAPPPLKEFSPFRCKGSTHYNVEIVVGEDEPVDEMIGRFRRDVLRAGILQEVKRRKFHENPRDKKKRKAREAARRSSRMRRRSEPMTTPTDDYPQDFEEERDFLDEGNWEMPVHETPY